jgi:hypothetical protein
MAQWEFLLQQEGREDWQPLGAQVTTGKYRLLCRSPWQNQEVPITITYIAADTGKQRQQKRSPRLNSQGLMVIMPFTSLQPGIWQWQVFHPEAPATPVTTVCLQVTAPVAEPFPSVASVDNVANVAKETSPEVAAPPQLETPIPLQTQKPVQKSIQNPISASTTETPLPQPPSNPDKNLDKNLDKNPDRPATIPPHRPLISIDALREQSLAEIDSVLQEAIDDVWDLVQTPALPNAFFSPDEDYIILDYDPLDDEVAYLSEINPDMEIGSGNYQENYPDNYHGSYPVIPQLIPQSIGEFALNNQTANAPVISFRLDQDHFVAQQGEYLVITGRVEIALGALLSGEELPAELRDTFLQGSVHYQLRDPDSSSILINTDYPLQVKVPVGEFSHTLKIPFKTNSHLLLGEATLYGKEQQVLGSKSFIVSANLDRLLQTVQDIPEDLPLPVLSPSKRQNQPVLPYQPKLDVDPKARKAFPKPLNSSYNAKGRIKSLHLPNFSGKTSTNLDSDPNPLVTSEPNPNQAADQLSALDNFAATTSNFGQGSKLINPQNDEAIESLVTPEILATTDNPETIEALAIPATPESLETPEAGLSEGNFLSRLNTLAIDKQMTEILHTELLLDQAAPGALDRQLLPPASDPDWRVLEVVVDDEPPEPEPEPRFDASGFPYPQKLVTPALTPDQAPRPVPTPEIIAPVGELLIGESVTVTVKLPAQQFSLYAKFWVKDCQTTAIIDGPRLLLDFSPNGQGELETLTRLTVPPGCCRVRLEAIAIDPLQEKESRKVSIDRVVVPPDTPDLSATGLSYLAS